MALVWSARAKRDLRSIGAYIAKGNGSAALVMIKRIVSAAEHLTDHPLLGHAGRVADTRELIVAGTPYIVVYRAGNRGVRIVAVLHSSREWPDSF